jgi:hypothetical protein
VFVCNVTNTESVYSPPSGVIVGAATVSVGALTGGAVTSRLKLVVFWNWLFWPLTTTVAEPIGVETAVWIVIKVEHVGSQDCLEKEAEAPCGSPDTEKETAALARDAEAALIVIATGEPCPTETLPLLERLKSYEVGEPVPEETDWETM